MAHTWDHLSLDTDVRVTTLDDVQECARAFGTLAKRRGLAKTQFVIARDEGEECREARIKLIAGIVMSGHDAIDLGVADARIHEGALNHLTAPAGIRLAYEDEHFVLEVYMNGGPLVGSALKQVRAVLEDKQYSAGTGTLTLVDVAGLPAHMPVSRDTVVGSVR